MVNDDWNGTTPAASKSIEKVIDMTVFFLLLVLIGQILFLDLPILSFSLFCTNCEHFFFQALGTKIFENKNEQNKYDRMPVYISS